MLTSRVLSTRGKRLKPLNVDINERDSQFGGDRKNYEFEDDLNSAERGKKEEIAAVEEIPRVTNRNDSGLNLYV